MNKILLYADKQCILHNTRQHKLLIAADFIISGEKEGLAVPTPKDISIIAIGNDPVCFDEAIAAIMGMDIKKIPAMVQARNITGRLRLTEKYSMAIIRSNVICWSDKHVDEIKSADTFKFEPTSIWKGHIKLQ